MCQFKGIEHKLTILLAQQSLTHRTRKTWLSETLNHLQSSSETSLVLFTMVPLTYEYFPAVSSSIYCTADLDSDAPHLILSIDVVVSSVDNGLVNNGRLYVRSILKLISFDFLSVKPTHHTTCHVINWKNDHYTRIMNYPR